MINFKKENENKKSEKDLDIFLGKEKKSENSFDNEEKNIFKDKKFKFQKKEQKSSNKDTIKDIFLLIEEILKKIKISFLKGGNTSLKIMGILWGITIISGILYFSYSADDTPKVVFERKISSKEIEKQKLYIYFPEGDSIINNEIEVNKIGNKDFLFRTTLDETIKKLKELDKIPNINEKIEVFYYIVNNVIYLDFPEKVFDKVKTPKEELLLIYSFVNTMTNVDTNVNTVKILINGMDIDKVKYANLKRDFKFRKDI